MKVTYEKKTNRFIVKKTVSDSEHGMPLYELLLKAFGENDQVNHITFMNEKEIHNLIETFQSMMAIPNKYVPYYKEKE